MRGSGSPREPLLVYVVWHSEADSIHPLAGMIHDRLSGFRRPPRRMRRAAEAAAADADWLAFQPPGVAVRFGVGHRRRGRISLPSPVGEGEADHVVVVLIVDPDMFEERDAWAPWIADQTRLLGITGKPGEAHALAVVARTRSADSMPVASQFNYVPSWDEAGAPVSDEQILQHVVVIGLRKVLVRTAGADPEVGIFLCHTKHGASEGHPTEEGGGEPIAVALRQYLSSTLQARVFYDRTDLPHAGAVRESIVAALRTTALLVVMTDRLPESVWCRLEIATAVELDRPIIVLDAVHRGVSRPPLSLAAATRIRWGVGIERVATVVLIELLRTTTFERQAEGRRAGVVFRANPSFRIGGSHRSRSRTTIVYPDPPIAGDDLALLGPSRWRSYSMYLADRHFGDGDLPLAQGGVRVAFALSISETGAVVSDTGLSQRHVDDVFCEVARLLVLLGGRIVLGTDLRPGGFTDQLLDVLERHRPAGPLPDCLGICLADPVYAGLTQDARDDLRELGDLYRAPAPEDGSMAAGFTEMRREILKLADARIAFGGKLSRYAGQFPGVVEEVLLSLEEGHPVYLLGGFGGATRAIFDALADPGAASPQLFGTAEGVAARLLRFGLADLSAGNGLDEAQNRELATTVDRHRMIDLLATGLSARLDALRARAGARAQRRRGAARDSG